jgi:hypothetical protein
VWSNRYFQKLATKALIVLLGAGCAIAQQPASQDTMERILDRLNTLEKQNQTLLEEIKALREAVKAQQPASAAQASEDLNARVSVAENRIEEQAQTKVNSSQRFPISLTGMLLFDSSLIHGTESHSYDPDYANYSEGYPGGGATLRQSIIGLTLEGPHIAGGGQIHGSISMDFDAAGQTSDVFRIRNGDVSFDWTNRSLTVGQDKTIIAPLQPASFAHVGVPALAGAGNLWLWRPQIKYEERRALSSHTRVVLQAALFSTDESSATNVPGVAYAPGTRPALQARIGIAHDWSDRTKFSLGVGAHESESHILGKSVASHVLSSDFLFKPLRWLEVSGTVLRGENFANLGGLPTGVTVEGTNLIAIKGSAGWMQVALPVTNRLTFDGYAGRQVNASRSLTPDQIAGTLVYAGNILYRIGPNVILGFEGAHENIVYPSHTLTMANRYDATLAYLF